MFKVKAWLYEIIKTYFGKCVFHFIGERIHGFSPGAYRHEVSRLSWREWVFTSCSVGMAVFADTASLWALPAAWASGPVAVTDTIGTTIATPQVVKPPFWNCSFSEKKKRQASDSHLLSLTDFIWKLTCPVGENEDCVRYNNKGGGEMYSDINKHYIYRKLFTSPSDCIVYSLAPLLVASVFVLKISM